MLELPELHGENQSAISGKCNYPNTMWERCERLQYLLKFLRSMPHFVQRKRVASSSPAHNNQCDSTANQKHARPPPWSDLLSEKKSPSQRARSVAKGSDRNHQTDVLFG